MNEEKWQRELAQVNRDIQEDELRRLDERWDRLSRGTLSPEEDAELRALAGSSEEAQVAYEAFKPLGPEFHASVVRAIRTQGLPPAPARAPAKVLPIRRRLAGWGAATALAAAASVVLVLRPLAPLPDYSLTVAHTVSEMRGESPEPSEIPVLAPGEGFRISVRPETEVSRGSKLEALGFLFRNGELRPLEVRSRIASSGVVELEGSLGRDIPAGTWTVWAVVGRPGKLPDPEVLPTLSAEAGARERDWVAVPGRVQVQIREPEP